MALRCRILYLRESGAGNKGNAVKNDDELLSFAQASELTGVSLSTLARAARGRRLAAVRVGAVWVVRKSELERWKSADYHPTMQRKKKRPRK